MQLAKPISITLLLLPLLLLITYTPASSHTTSPSHSPHPLLSQLTSFSQSLSIQNRLIQRIDKKIQQLKLIVSTQQEYLRCPSMTKYSANSSSTVDLIMSQLQSDCQFCKGSEDRGDDVWIFGVIVGSQVGEERYKDMGVQLGNMEIQLNQKLGVQVHITWQKLSKSILPQHLQQKTQTDLYQKTLISQLSNIAQSQHCRYTHIPCRSHTILLLPWPSLSQSYLRIKPHSAIIAHPNNYKQSIVSLLGGQCLQSVQQLGKIMQINRLNKLKKQLGVFFGLCEQTLCGNFSMGRVDVRKLDEFAKRVDAFVDGQSKQLPRLMDDSDGAFSIDLFPTQYKVGVFLPFLLIIIIFPISNVIKI